jgi:hypothetical protein
MTPNSEALRERMRRQLDLYGWPPISSFDTGGESRSVHGAASYQPIQIGPDS